MWSAQELQNVFSWKVLFFLHLLRGPALPLSRPLGTELTNECGNGGIPDALIRVGRCEGSQGFGCLRTSDQAQRPNHLTADFSVRVCQGLEERGHGLGRFGAAQGCGRGPSKFGRFGTEESHRFFRWTEPCEGFGCRLSDPLILVTLCYFRQTLSCARIADQPQCFRDCRPDIMIAVL